MEELIKKLQLQLQILQLQLQVLLLKKKLTIPNLPDPRYIIIHHGAGSWDFNQVNWNHQQKWGFKSSLGHYIGYQYFIEYSGKVYQGRADNEEGAHTVGSVPHYYNRESIGICLQGNMETETPTPAQIKSLTELIDGKKEQYHIDNNRVYGHRELQNTLCPGRNLWVWLMRNYPSFGKSLG